MRVGDLRGFESDKGRHRSPEKVECGGRLFRVVAVGTGGLYGGYGECVLCCGEVRIYENGIESPPTFGEPKEYRERY